MTAATPAATPQKAGLIAISVAAFGSSAMMRVCDPMLPVLAQVFDVSTGRAAQTVSTYAIAYGLLQLMYGPLGDRYGKRRVIGLAALGCTVGNVVALLATNLPMLIAARVLSGATAAAIIPLSLAFIGDTVAYERRQEVLARFLTATLSGMIVGQWGSGMLVDTLGWRWTFGVLIALFLGVGLRLCADPTTRGERSQLPSAAGHLRGALDVLSIPWARSILALVAVEGAFAFAVMAFLPAFEHSEFGLGMSWAAAIVALYGVGGFLYAFGARALLRRFGESGLALLGGALIACAWVGVALASHWAWSLPACAVGGLGYYMLHNTLTTHATQMAPALRGTAVSLFAASLFVGIAIGVSVAGMVVDRIGYRLVFAFSGIVLLLLGALFAASLRRRLMPGVAQA
jgi:predicted MFS family arabinose efflux permease